VKEVLYEKRTMRSEESSNEGCENDGKHGADGAGGALSVVSAGGMEDALIRAGVYFALAEFEVVHCDSGAEIKSGDGLQVLLVSVSNKGDGEAIRSDIQGRSIDIGLTAGIVVVVCHARCAIVLSLLDVIVSLREEIKDTLIVPTRSVSIVHSAPKTVKREGSTLGELGIISTNNISTDQVTVLVIAPRSVVLTKNIHLSLDVAVVGCALHGDLPLARSSRNSVYEISKAHACAQCCYNNKSPHLSLF